MISNNHLIIIIHFWFRLTKLCLWVNHDTQLRHKIHLSLELLYYESNNQLLCGKMSLMKSNYFSLTISITSIKIQHKKFINCTLQLSLSKRFRIDEKVNTIDDSNRNIFSVAFLSRKHIKNILCHSIYLSRPCIEIEMLLASLIDNIIMTQIVSYCYSAKC